MKTLFRLLSQSCFVLWIALFPLQTMAVGLNHLTPAEEKELGSQFMLEILKSERLLQDPVVVSYVQSLGNRLARVNESKKQGYYFFVVNDPSVNAFAGPGGYIGVNTGLILIVKNEGELAAVLAHEIAHVSQRHLARTIDLINNTRIPSYAALLAAIALGVINPVAGAAAVTAGMAGQTQMLINFTRSNEYEADRVGMKSLYLAGFNPIDMPNLFRRMQQDRRLYPDGPPEYLSTHPLTYQRIADTEARALEYPKRTVKRDSLFPFIQARVVVDSANNRIEAFKYFQRKIKQKPKSIVYQYGYSLALMGMKQDTKAEQIMDGLIKAFPKNELFQLSAAEIANANHQPQKALTWLTPLYHKHPIYYPVVISYAKALIEAGKAQQAIQLLRDKIRKIPNQAQLWFLLAKAQANNGELAESHLTQAQLLIKLGSYKAAMRQLQIASRQPAKEKYTKLRIQGQMTELKRLMKSSMM